jgi:enediyne core biosynthesis thioesterase
VVNEEVVSTGYQQIVFARQDKRIQRLPEHILRKVREYELPAAAVRN